MPRSTTLFALLLLAPLLASACGGQDLTNPSTDPSAVAVAVTETFNETLNPNGGRTHPFAVQTIGTVTARITAVAPDDTVRLGLSLGTWNGAVCQIILANDNAGLNDTITGTAQQIGHFCVRLYDALGTLIANVDYTVDVTHF